MLTSKLYESPAVSHVTLPLKVVVCPAERLFWPSVIPVPPIVTCTDEILFLKLFLTVPFNTSFAAERAKPGIATSAVCQNVKSGLPEGLGQQPRL